MDTSAWIWRYYFVVPVADLAAAQAVAARLDPDTGGGSTFAVALSLDGSGPATHMAARVPATASMHNEFVDAKSEGLLPTLIWFRVWAATLELRGSSISDLAARAVGTEWEMFQTLGVLGLSRVVVSDMV